MIYFLRFICIWSVIGYFAFAALSRTPLPEKKEQVLIMLFLAGPLCWFLFLFVCFFDKVIKQKT